MKKRFFGAFFLTLFLFGCGGSDSGSGETGSNSSNVEDENQTEVDNALNHTWLLAYNDEMGNSYADIVIVNNGQITSLQMSDQMAIGTATYNENMGQLKVNLSLVDGKQIELTLSKNSSSLYQGVYGDGYAQMTQYGDDRSQDMLTGSWKTEVSSYDFAIDEQGLFSSVHDISGCRLDGAMTYQSNGIYTLDGVASACIDGALDGEFSGYGMIYTVSTVWGQRVGVAQLNFDHGATHSMADRYQPLTILLQESIN